MNERKSVETVLWGPSGPPKGNDHKDLLFQQYRLLVETSEALVARRQPLNSFFLSVNSLILAASGVIIRTNLVGPVADLGERLRGPAVVALGISGILACFSWRRLVQSSKQLNKGKFEVIHLLERHLPASLFAAEWEALGGGRDSRKYRPFTATETHLATVFGLFHGAATALGLWSVAERLGWSISSALDWVIG